MKALFGLHDPAVQHHELCIFCIVLDTVPSAPGRAWIIRMPPIHDDALWH